MEQQGKMPQPMYPGYGLFAIEERNGYPQEPGAQWRIVAAAPNSSIEDPAYPRYRTRHPSLDGAVSEVKARLEAERARLLERAEGCAQQLARLDEMYIPQPSPAQALTAVRERLVEVLCRWKQGENVGYPKFGGFGVDFSYMRSEDLLVFNLPEYNAISPRFLPTDVELILAIVAEAGFKNFEHWNGAGCYTMSVRVPRAQRAGLKNAEATEA